jgi:hypothetical protein
MTSQLLIRLVSALGIGLALTPATSEFICLSRSFGIWIC